MHGSCKNSPEEIKLASEKACSGKCMSGGCAPSPRTWIIAACEGMLVILEKQKNGHLEVLSMGEDIIAPTIESFQKYMVNAIQGNAFIQLIMVGSANDISWARISLPDNLANKIIAEIKYPLVQQWFRNTSDMKSLSNAVEQVLTS